MKRLREILHVFIAFLLTGWVVLIPQNSALAADSISARGKAAIEQIATCINSEGKDTLNVFYLIDDSSSLLGTDPDSLRRDGIRTSLNQFRNVSDERPYFTVNRAFATFGDEFTLRSNWKELSEKQIDRDQQWIDEQIPTWVDGQATDWELGLKGALASIEEVTSASSCNVVVWFTDGGINPNKPRTANGSLGVLCGTDPENNANSGARPLIDDFRESGIFIQGVLLENKDYFKNPEKYGDSPPKAALVKSLMSFFQPVLEQSGAVNASAFGGNEKTSYECGSYKGAGGVQQVIGDPVDILWPPVLFNCLSSNGRVLPLNGGKVTVDPGLSRFTFTSPVRGLEMKNQAGELIASEKGASPAELTINPVNKSGSIKSFSGSISTAGGVLAPGTWTIKTSDAERSVFCGFLDLTIDVKAEACYEGEICKFSGGISREGKPAKLSDFNSTVLEVTDYKNPGNIFDSSLSASNSTFSGKFNGAPGIGIQKLLLKLSLKTKSNLEFTFSTIKEVNVLPPGTYPEVNPNPIKAADFSQKLEGKAGKAISQITLKAPSRTSGEICFDALQVRNDPKPSRISKFKAAIDGKDLTGQQCFSLNPGQDKKVQLTVENKDSADGIASGFINTTLKSDGKSAVKDKLGIEIPTTTKINIILAILIFALLLLAGVAIPLALMYLLNSINARLRLRNLYYAQIPVKLDASGNFVTLRRNDDSKSSEIFQGDDFRPFSSGEQRQKSLQIGAIKLEGKAPRNPFGNVTGLLTANPGTVITSNQIQSIKNPQSYQATGSLNPANMMYLTLTESALENLKKKNDGDHQITQTIEGEISTFVDLTSGAGEIVQELNMRDTGWINKILNIAPTLPPVEKIKRTKPQKKESAQVTAQAPTPTSNTDDWGTSPTTKGTPKDDWDSPSGGSSSNNDGWGDSSGSSGGKKNDDW